MVQEGTPDRFRPLRILGEGGSGRVWLAEDRLRGGAQVAVKELPPTGGGGAAALRHEFATLTQLSHPNLIQVFDLDWTAASGAPRIAMEYVRGQEFLTAVTRGGTDLLLNLIVEALRALSFLHDFKRIHRDLKPANLLVRDEPRLGSRLVLLDFGLVVRDDALPQNPPTAGTLPYLAPELFEGKAPSARSDLYALGSLIFEAVHRRTPIRLRDGDVPAFIAAVREGRRARPTLPDRYPEGLGSWLDEMLDPDPRRRPADAADAFARLHQRVPIDTTLETAVTRRARIDSGSPPGREKVVARLRKLLSPEGGPRTVFLTGREGSGRRRLMRWFVGEAVLQDRDVIAPPSGRLLDTGESSPDRAFLNRLEEWRERARRRAVLVVLDQSMEIDPWTAAFLERVAREPDEPPIKVLVAVDPSAARHPILSRLIDPSEELETLATLDLNPLEHKEIRAMAQRARSGTISGAKLRWLAETSEGRPDLVRALLVSGEWEKPVRSAPAQALLRDRHARLAEVRPDTRSWLEALAALIEPAEDGIVRQVAGIDASASAAAASESFTCGLARRRGLHWSLDGRSLASFILDSIPSDRRNSLLDRAAEAVRTTEPLTDHGEKLAAILIRAGRHEEAIDVLDKLAHALSKADAYRAAEALTQALRCQPRRGDRVRRKQFRVRQANAWRAANYPQEATRAFGAAAFLSESPAEQAELRAAQAAVLVQTGRFSRAREAAEIALRYAKSHGLEAVEAEARRAIGISHARCGQANLALPHVRRAVAIYARLNRPLAEAQALQALALCELDEGLEDAAKRHHFRSIEIYDRIGRPWQGLVNWNGLATLDLRAGRYLDAKKRLMRARELCDRGNNLLLHAVITTNLARTCAQRNELSRALRYSVEAEEQARHLGDTRLVWAARAYRAEALTRGGRAPEAMQCIDRTLSQSADQVDPSVQTILRGMRVEAALALPDVDPTWLERISREFLQLAERSRDPDTLPWARCLELERRLDPDAEESLASLLQLGAPWDQPAIRIRMDLAATRIALRGGNTETARIRGEQAIDRALQHELHDRAAEAAACLVSAFPDRPAEAVRYQDLGRRFLDHAAQSIDDEAMRTTFRERAVFAPLHSPIAAAPSTTDRRLVALYEMGRILNSESEPDRVIASLLDVALNLVRAERGLVLLRQGAEYVVTAARNLDAATVCDAEAYSRSIVADAGTGRSVLSVDARTDEKLRGRHSISLYGIQSVLCVPLRDRSEPIGAVYLDSRTEGTIFTEEDRVFLEAFADQIALALENRRRRQALESENRKLQDAAASRVRFGNILGESPAMLKIFEEIEQVAASDLPVLIQGESGTGKELVARAIHFNGPRKSGPFHSENCAAIPESLLQSELFGHVAGSFTGADRERQGLFELSDGGTLFLDEVGDMAPAMQAQLLRVLQEGEVRPVGSNRPIQVDVRVLFATHRDLEKRVADGSFREDLYFRIRVLTLQMPALRERAGDVALLVGHFLQRIAETRGRPVAQIDPALLAKLERHPWPGNVRQLENTLQRLTLLAQDGVLGPDALEQDPSLRPLPISVPEGRESSPLPMHASERDQIVDALRETRGNRTRAAKLLGIGRATLYRKLREHRID